MKIPLRRCFLFLLSLMIPVIAFNEDSIPTKSIPGFPVTASLSTGSNLPLRYRYDFDLNALQDGIRVGDFMVALTESGNLISYDLKRMAIIAVNPKYKATCIGNGKGETILSGFVDGKIAIVDPATLQLTPYAQMDSRVTWIGSAFSIGKQEITVAVSDKSFDEPPPFPGLTNQQYQTRYDPPLESHELYCKAQQEKHRNSLTAKILPNGSSFPFSPFSSEGFCDVYPNAYAVDAKGHLWMGVDAGEFGGICACLDLKTGKIKIIEDANILGILTCSDGRVLAYGGMVHFGMETSLIARIDQMKWQPLLQNSNDTWKKDSAAEKDDKHNRGPLDPIDDIVELKTEKGFCILAGHQYYKTDYRFSEWSEGIRTDLLFQSGRAASIGNSPILKKPIPSRTPDCYWGALKNGLFYAAPNQSSLYRIPGLFETPSQMRFSGVFDSMPLKQETIFMTREAVMGGLTYWHTKDQVWERLDKAAAQSIAQHFSFNNTAFRIQDDQIEYLGKQQNWLKVQVLDEPKDKFFEADWISSFIGFSYSFLGIRGSVPIIWDRNRSRLGKIVWNAADETFSFQPINYSISKDIPGPLWDAYPIEDENILIVSTQGLHRFNAIDGSLTALSMPEPAANLRSICKDLAGRYWLAGDKIYFSNDSGKKWIPLDLPIIGPTWIKQIRPNPQVHDGIFLLMADRGILFLEPN
jgi:hypothetical protein